MSVRTARTALVLTVLLILGACGSDHGSGHGDAGAEPGDPAKATRTIEVAATDDLKFNPPTVGVTKGETVTFKVVNPTAVPHEFVVGDVAFQDEHETEMRNASGGMTMTDEKHGVEVAPGETKTITLTFPTAGTLMYGCHVVGHYPAGMKGDIKVT